MLSFAGGLGLFLFGIATMGQGLQKLGGPQLRRHLEAVTSHPVLGVGVGTAVTALFQSSTATTVMVVGFVNAGLMTLPQAAAVIVGANVGTTITAQLVAIRVTDFALPLIAVGSLLQLAGGRTRLQFAGQALLGFGVLFLGLATMAGALSPVARSPGARALLAYLATHPVQGLIAGAAFTAIVQSSSATTGITVGLAQEGIITLPMALPLIMGANVGTCVTALLASAGASLAARRAAVAHLLFNVGGVVVLGVFIQPYAALVSRLGETAARQVANAHTLFNLATTAAVLPLLGPFTRLVQRVVPGRPEDLQRGPRFLDPRLVPTPWAAIGQARKETVYMAGLSLDNLRLARELVFDYRWTVEERLKDREEVIDQLEEAITIYLVEVARSSLTGAESEFVSHLLHSTNDIERVGDHAEAIATLAKYRHDHQLQFSPTARNELAAMFQLVENAVERAVQAVATEDRQLAQEVIGTDDLVDRMERDLRDRHIGRLNQGTCVPAAGMLFLDIISHLERIGDHAENLAETVV
ncbi:MAG: Na/Pi cotransporter family protein [Bacillota bacterium]